MIFKCYEILFFKGKAFNHLDLFASMKSYHVGTSGWMFKEWKGIFYPNDVPQKNWFLYYTSIFSSVEINASYYRWPSASVIKKWEENAPKDFVYTMKIPQIITHIKRLQNVTEDIKSFYKTTSGLKEHLGCHLFQLPPSFRNDEKNLSRVEAVLKAMHGENAFEFRHDSWWTTEVQKLFKEHNVAFASVIGRDIPESLIVTSDVVYVRLHGVEYATSYSKEDLADLASKLKSLKKKKVYAYFNNDVKAYSPQNAMVLKELLKA